MRGTMLHHYTTEHSVEYVIVALFIWRIIDLVLKLLTFPREYLALRQEWLPPRRAREPVANANGLLAHVRAQPQWLQRSKIGKRLAEALGYVTEKGRLC
jgi:hypothetical protein